MIHETKSQNKIKVLVKLFSNDQFFGNIFVSEGERVQDLLNDARKFIPIEKSHYDRGRGSDEVHTVIVISKDAIASIEEI